MYPIGKFIQETMKQQGLPRKVIGHRLGYKNPGKGFEMLDACVEHGWDPGPVFRERLALALGVPLEKVNAAFQETEGVFRMEEQMQLDEKEVQEMARFRPFLWVIPERKVPGPIFIVAFCGDHGFLRASLPCGTTTLPLDRQQGIVRRCCTKHYAKGVMNPGTAGPFGRILGYKYYFTYEDYWVVSVDGKFERLEHGALSRPECTVKICGKTIPSGPSGFLGKFGFKAGPSPNQQGVQS